MQNITKCYIAFCEYPGNESRKVLRVHALPVKRGKILRKVAGILIGKGGNVKSILTVMVGEMSSFLATTG